MANKTASSSSVDVILEKVKTGIKRRGEGGIKDLARTFKIYDDNNSKSLNKPEFKKGLEDYGVRLSTGEIDIVFSKFDQSGDGEISYDEFLLTLRGEMNEARKQLVKKAYAKLDKTGDGLVTQADIKILYNARKHPKVVSGEKTEDEVLKDFLNNFDKNQDGTLTYEEFENYYTGVSASIDDDAYFNLMMFNAWKF